MDLRVLHISEYAKGGLATYINELLKEQTSREHLDVYLAISDYSQRDFLHRAEKIFRYDYKRTPLQAISAIIKIHRIIKKVRPDIIHIHSTFAGFFARVPYFLIRKDVKIVYCSHGWAFTMDVSPIKKRIFGLVERMLSFRTDLIINISKYEQREAIRYGIPEHKMVTVYNGIAPPERVQRYDNAKVNLDPNKINLLFVGRFDRQKGTDLLLDMFRSYELEHIQLLLIGEAVLAEGRLQIPDSVLNIGWVDNRMIDQYYNLADAVIIPSRWEGFGLVAIEAMKNRKAVIASNRGALPEIVENNRTGYIFDLDHMETLVDILRTTTKEELAAMGEAGYERYTRMFQSDTMNETIINYYEKLCSGHKDMGKAMRSSAM